MGTRVRHRKTALQHNCRRSRLFHRCATPIAAKIRVLGFQYPSFSTVKPLPVLKLERHICSQLTYKKIMVEGSIRSYDPLAYHVNNVKDIRPEILRAHRKNDTEEIKRLLAEGEPSDYDVFICVNEGWHAFVLCAPANEVTPENDPLNVFQDMPIHDPFAIPNQLLVWEAELRFESAQQRMYKIRFKLSMYGEIKSKIKRCFYIGKYKRVPVSGLQLAVLRASPRRYKVLLDDCVEFAKTFCYELLSFSDNGREIEKLVGEQLDKASGSGFSVEVLSRRVRSSGLVGNTFFGGLDASAFLGDVQCPRGIVCVTLVMFLTLYPIVVTLLVLYFKGS